MKTKAEWLNENAYRAFPFEENSSGECTDGTSMPNWLILDAQAMVEEITSNGTVSTVPDEVMQIVSFSVYAVPGVEFIHTSVRVRINFYTQFGPSSFETVALGQVTAGSVFHWTETVGTRGIHVKLSFGAPASLDEAYPLSGNEWHVLKSPRPVLGTRCIYSAHGFGMTTLQAGGTVLSFPYGGGKILLQDGSNTSLRVVDGAVVLDIGAKSGLMDGCPGSVPYSRGLRMINGQHADSDGSFSFVAGPGIKIGQGDYNGIPGVTVSTDSRIDSMAGRR